ncbi:MAG: amino acid-binding protein [Gemmataceae bacterium]
MALRIHRVQVWSAEIPDKPGAAAAMLERLTRAGADLEFLMTRPHRGKPDVSVLFLAPVQGAEQIEAAHAAGLAPARDVAMLCVESENRPGIGAQIMSSLAVAGINLRGISISTVGDSMAAYLAFDNEDSARLAVQVLATLT